MKARVLQMLWLVGIPLDDPLWNELNSCVEFLNKQLLKVDKTTTNNRLTLANLYISKYSSLIKNSLKLKINNFFFESEENALSCDDESIQNEQEIIKNIETAMLHWSVVLDTKCDINEYNTLEIIDHVISLTELHNRPICTVQLILILYQLSKMVKNNVYKIKALTYLLKYVTCSKLYKQIIEDGAQTLKDIYKDEQYNDTNLDKCYLELSFLLNQSYNLFIRKQFTDGYEIMKTIQDKYNNNNTLDKRHKDIFEVEKDFLRLKYFNLPCKIAVDQEHTCLLVHAAECFELAVNLLKKISKRNEDYLLKVLQYFIEISQWIANFYLNLNQPRESRCYAKNVFRLLSNLQFPLRYAQILSIQCQLDLMNGKYDDALLRFNKILDILNIAHNKNTQQQIHEISEKINQISLSSTDIDTLLDNPIRRIPKITLNTAASSPSFTNKSNFNYFLSHPMNCLCFLCTNYVYQKLCFECFAMDIFLKKINIIENYDYLIEDIKKSMNILVDKIRNKSMIQLPSNFQPDVLQTNIVLDEIENDVRVVYYKFILRICNELFANDMHYEKILQILTNCLKSFVNIETNHGIAAQMLSLICKVKLMENSNVIAHKSKEKSVSISTPEKPKPHPLLFATPSKRMDKFLKSRTPGPTSKFQIYTPKTEKINRLPPPIETNSRTVARKNILKTTKMSNLPNEVIEDDDDVFTTNNSPSTNKFFKTIIPGREYNSTKLIQSETTKKVQKTSESKKGKLAEKKCTDEEKVLKIKKMSSNLYADSLSSINNIKTPLTNKTSKIQIYTPIQAAERMIISESKESKSIKEEEILVKEKILLKPKKLTYRKLQSSHSNISDLSCGLTDLDDDDVFIDNDKTPCTIVSISDDTDGVNTSKLQQDQLQSSSQSPVISISDDSDGVCKNLRKLQQDNPLQSNSQTSIILVKTDGTKTPELKKSVKKVYKNSRKLQQDNSLQSSSKSSVVSDETDGLKTPELKRGVKKVYKNSRKLQQDNLLQSSSKSSVVSDETDEIKTSKLKKSVEKVYKSSKKLQQENSLQSSSKSSVVSDETDGLKTPELKKSVEKVYKNSRKLQQDNLLNPLKSNSKSSVVSVEIDGIKTPQLKKSVEKVKQNSRKLHQERDISSNNYSTDLYSELNNLDGDDGKIKKTPLVTNIKNDVPKNKQARNKFAVKSETNHFCGTSIDDCDNLAVNLNKCLNYKHTYSKLIVNDHLSEQFSSLTIEKDNSNSSEMTHTSPLSKKIKVKHTTKASTSKDEEKLDNESEPRRMRTRRAKEVAKLQLIDSDDNNTSLEKSSIDVPSSPQIPKKIVKTTTKKVNKAKQQSNSSPNAGESVPKARKKAKNPFIL